MDWNYIYELLVAALPSATAIVTTVVTGIRSISQCKAIKSDVKAITNVSDMTILLKKQSEKLDQIAAENVELKKELNTVLKKLNNEYVPKE